MTSFVFPGQGSQYVGMSKDFHDNYKIAKLAFEEIEDYTNIHIRKIIFNNEDKKLDLTQFTQICIFATSYVIFKTFTSEKNYNLDNINVMMGHSLGEYTALACSNKIRLKDCCEIIKVRSELMNNAVKPNETGMAALIGQDSKYVQNIIKENNLQLEIANDNSPIQVVISGSIDDIRMSKEIFKNNHIKRFVELNVSAAFHSKYMLDAQKSLSQLIEKLFFNESKINIISNFDANITPDTNIIKNNLQKQMANKVRWTEGIRKLEEMGERNIIEIGPGNILGGLISRISKEFDIISINKISDLNNGN